MGVDAPHRGRPHTNPPWSIGNLNCFLPCGFFRHPVLPAGRRPSSLTATNARYRRWRRNADAEFLGRLHHSLPLAANCRPNSVLDGKNARGRPPNRSDASAAAMRPLCPFRQRERSYSANEATISKMSFQCAGGVEPRFSAGTDPYPPRSRYAHDAGQDSSIADQSGQIGKVRTSPGRR